MVCILKPEVTVPEPLLNRLPSLALEWPHHNSAPLPSPTLETVAISFTPTNCIYLPDPTLSLSPILPTSSLILVPPLVSLSHWATDDSGPPVVPLQLVPNAAQPFKKKKKCYLTPPPTYQLHPTHTHTHSGVGCDRDRAGRRCVCVHFISGSAWFLVSFFFACSN